MPFFYQGYMIRAFMLWERGYLFIYLFVSFFLSFCCCDFSSLAPLEGSATANQYNKFFWLITMMKRLNPNRCGVFQGSGFQWMVWWRRQWCKPCEAKLNLEILEQRITLRSHRQRLIQTNPTGELSFSMRAHDFWLDKQRRPLASKYKRDKIKKSLTLCKYGVRRLPV